MNQTNEATSTFAPLWRRKWLILAVGILVAAVSYLHYRGQPNVFSSTTQIYLGAGAEEQAPGERTVATKNQASITNQVGVIDSIVVEKVRRQLRREHKGKLGRGKVTAKVGAKSSEKSEFISIVAEGHTRKGTALLANRTAETYIQRQSAVRQRSIEAAIAITRRQLRRIEAGSLPRVSSKTTGANGKSEPNVTTTANVLQTANLSSKINQLESSLGLPGAQHVKPARAATAQLLAPNPRRNAIFGFVIGIVLASIAAYALARFDRRLRSLAGVEAVLQTRILAAFPRVRRPITSPQGQPLPSRFMLEPLRQLHAALALQAPPAQDGHRSGRVILFTSADAGDGKSTLVADLALVQRDAGERVAVVEANLRRSVQSAMLGLEPSRGLVEVLSGRLRVDEALQRVLPLTHAEHVEVPVGGGVATAVEAPVAGSLFLLAGGAVPNPTALLNNGGMRDVLQSVAEDFDYVLIDAPSPLEVSDVMPLLQIVDGIVIVARLAHTREPSAQRLVQLLSHSARAPVLGAAANCVPRREAARYGLAPSGGAHGSARLFGR